MITPELAAYIKNELEKGSSAQQVKSLLMISGWTEEDIDAATAQAIDPLPEAETTTDHKSSHKKMLVLFIFIFLIGLVAAWFFLGSKILWLNHS